ncbi:MAG: ATP-grasp domain-containing protein [Gammaproteobacteria bacterium]|nr:ATP-grasp domain-containing protein [Gammaproteobacteria bacterium]
MQNQHKPVLIFAQSGRFLAQSATQAGYTVWVVDCFGDTDTIAASERWLQLPTLSKLSEKIVLETIDKITLGEPCIVICGSGIEFFSDFLANLPSNVDYLGNSINTIKSIKTPSTFFNLLKRLNIPHPQTQFTPPKLSVNWITKSAKGMGGIHIQNLNSLSRVSDECYFQQYISGVSCSALFLASEHSLTILSINKQSLDPGPESPFRLGQIEAPFHLSKSSRQNLTSIIEKLVSELQLVGLNSLDFIYTATDHVLILEINPRPSASIELVTSDSPIIQLHIDACMDKLDVNTLNNSSSFKSLSYFYADNDYLIPNNMVWPKACSDLPSDGTSIKRGEPICSFLVECCRNENENLRSITKHKVLSQLIPIT